MPQITEWLDQFRQDLQYAWRGLRRSPGFTLTAIAAIAIGIGTATAVFSFTHRILFRPPPYAQEQEMAWPGMTAPIEEVGIRMAARVQAEAPTGCHWG